MVGARTAVPRQKTMRIAELTLPCVDPARTADFYASLPNAVRTERGVRFGDVEIVFDKSHRLSVAFAGTEAAEEAIDPDGRVVRIVVADGQFSHGVVFNPEDNPEDAGLG